MTVYIALTVMMKTTEAKTLRSNHPSAQSSIVNRNKDQDELGAEEDEFPQGGG